jgi:predicted NAD/FAD-dependent oxidoreductase
MKIVVVGAGISGSVCAWRLAREGHEVTLVEKGRGVGGRMATRRMEGARIDHGAQFFTVRDPRMEELLSLWQNENAVVPWYDHIPGRADVPKGQRYRGTEGMTSPAKVLAKEFKAETSFFLQRIQRKDKTWTLHEKDASQRTLEADHLVITIPSVQLLELFQRSDYELDDDSMNRLRSIRHTRCLAVLGIMNRSSSLKYPGTLTHPSPEIGWISDNQVKGISQEPSCTIHASDEYSQKFWDAPDSERVPLLLSVAQEYLHVKITSWSSHRWGFAKPVVTFGSTHWHSQERGISLAGDGFGGERIEKAAMSGWDAADAIIGNSASD